MVTGFFFFFFYLWHVDSLTLNCALQGTDCNQVFVYTDTHPESIIRFNCFGANDCKNLVVYSAKDIILYCQGSNSCSGTKIWCGSFDPPGIEYSTNDMDNTIPACDVECEYSEYDGKFGCKGAFLSCKGNGVTCNLRSTTDYNINNMDSSTLECNVGSGGTCNMRCHDGDDNPNGQLLCHTGSVCDQTNCGPINVQTINGHTYGAPTTAPTTSMPTTSAPTTSSPTSIPTSLPTTSMPTRIPTSIPTTSIPSSVPTTSVPTFVPSPIPTTSLPSSLPTYNPSIVPTSNPSKVPSGLPTTSVPTTSTPTDDNSQQVDESTSVPNALTSDAPNTESTDTQLGFGESTSDTQNESTNLITIIIVCVCFLIIVTSYIYGKYIKINDFYNVASLITASVHIIDLKTDIDFTLYIDRDSHIELFILSAVFIIMPIVITLYQLYNAINKWKKTDKLNIWVSDNTSLLYILSTLCGSSFTAILICKSNLFNLKYFNIPLSKHELISFQTKRVYSTVFLENIPQLVIQLVFIILSPETDNDIVYLAMTFSTLSILISILKLLTQRNMNRSRDYISISFDIKGQSVISKIDECRNRVSKIKKSLAIKLGINSSLIEITRPQEIPNGLALSINIYVNNVQSIDTDYKSLLIKLEKDGELPSIIEKSWKLSSLAIIDNINYKKHESKQRRNNKVIIKAMSTNAVQYNTDVAMMALPSAVEGANVVRATSGDIGSDEHFADSDSDNDNILTPQTRNDLILTDYMNQYGNSPANASQLQQFAKSDAKYNNLSYKEAKELIDDKV